MTMQTPSFRHRLGRLVAGATLMLAAGLATEAAADAAYPGRVVSIVVPFAAGGAPDLIARRLAEDLSKTMGQQFVIDNRAGAGGVTGTRYAASAAPDGYTLIMGTISSHAVNAAVYKKLPFDPVKDFEAVAEVGTTPSVLVVTANFPANSVTEFIAYGRTQRLKYGSSGVGSSNHLSGALLSQRYGLNAVHIPYQGGAASVVDLIGGQIDYLLYAPIALTEYVKSGQLKALATAGSKRNASLPDVPTMAEAGVPDFDVSGFAGMFAPKGTPAAILDRLHDEIDVVLRKPEFAAWMLDKGLDVTPGVSRQQFGEIVKFEIKRWSDIAEAAGAKRD